MVFTPWEIVVLIITGISFIDFIVFFGFFLMFITNVTITAEKWSVKIMSVIITCLFVIMKIMHLPIFMNSLYFINFKFIFPFSDYILIFLTWLNIALAIVPLFIGIYDSLIKFKPCIQNFSFEETVLIIMPIYNEKPESLWNAIQSVVDLNYNKQKLHLFLSFDDDQRPEAFLFLLYKWNLLNEINNPLITIFVNDLAITIIRTEHGGKKMAQKSAYEKIKTFYNKFTLEKSLLFFIDSDIILEKNCLNHFIFYMKTYNKTVMTGLITCMAKDKYSFITYLQDVFYISSQILTRNFESYLGSISCAPGALTILKYSVFDKIAVKYLNMADYKDLFTYFRSYLGEDRVCSLMLMKTERMGFCKYATCKTEAPDTLRTYVKQNRRWGLGAISNDVWMMSSMDIWKKYPILSLFNFLNNTRNTSIYVYLLYFVLFYNKNVSVVMWLLFIILPITALWIFISIHAIKINRKMNIIFYPVILFVQPILGMIYTYYTIYTFKQRSWGGVRVEKQIKEEI
jgi:chitin synthase